MNTTERVFTACDENHCKLETAVSTLEAIYQDYFSADHKNHDATNNCMQEASLRYEFIQNVMWLALGTLHEYIRDVNAAYGSTTTLVQQHIKTTKQIYGTLLQQ